MKRMTGLALCLALAGSGQAQQFEEVAGDSLVRQACYRMGQERLPQAWRLLTEGLAAAVAAGQWDDAPARAEAEVAALMLTDVTRRLENWTDTVAALEACRPWPEATPPALAFRLDRILSLALRSTGRVGETTELVESLGYVTDFLVIGPFDNERGSGFAVPYPPERGFDRDAPMPGKERPVQWREMPARSPLGGIDLAEMLRPATQGVAYLATAIESAGERDVVLRFGSSCAVKVFLNGREALARKVDRPYQPDQDRAPLRLKDGWNQLLVKVAGEDDGWSIELRFTDLAGMPLADLRVDSAQVAAPAGDTDLVVPDGLAAEARDILEAREDAESLRLLAFYHLLLHPDDKADRRARLAAERANELEPDDLIGLIVLADANAIQGESEVEREVNRRLHVLKKILEVDPQLVGAILDLADFSMNENPLPDRADELTRRAVQLNRESYRALRARAGFLGSRSRHGEAEEMYRLAVECDEGKSRATARADEARRMIRVGAVADAEQLLAAEFRRHTHGGDLFDELTRILVDTGRTDQAVELTDRLLVGTPFAVGLMLEQARLFEYGGAPDAARRLFERALEICPEHTEALLDLVRMDVREGHIASATARLDEVVRLDPGNETARRHRKLLSAEEKDDFDAPYRWDGVELAGAPAAAGGADEPLEMLRRTTVFKVNPDGTEQCYEHVVFRALNLGGVKDLDVYNITYPDRATLQVYNARIIKEDGSFERAPAPRGRDRRGRGLWQRYFDLPPIAVGDLVDVEFRYDQTEPDVFGEYFGTRHMFYPEQIDSSAPTRDSELVLLAPADVPLYVSERNTDGVEKSVAERADGLTERRWRARDLPRPPLQSAMPEKVEFAPVVDVSTYQDWNAFARWYWHFIEKEFVTTPEMKAKVAELTEGLTTEEDKVAAINRFVAQEIRYNSWPFGTHGYEPFSAATIFERRFGDCKDKSILFRQLLAEIGVEAIPVLIKADYSRPDETLAAAMVEQFNHCIAYVLPTDERPGYYLDGTASSNPVGYLRADDQGARVLHVHPDGGTIHQIPYAPPAENALLRTYVVTLDGQGNGVVELSDTSSGRYAVRLRYLFAGEQGDIAKILARELNDSFGAVAVESVDTPDLEDITIPAWLKARFAAKGLWTAESGKFSLRLGFDDVGLGSVASEAEGDRQYDVVLDRPRNQETTVIWKLPDGTRIARLPPAVHIEEPGMLRYDQQVEEQAGEVRVTRRFQIDVRRVPLADYGAFRRALREIQKAEERTILVEPPLGSEGF